MNSVQLAKKLGAKHIGPNVNIKSIGDILKTPRDTNNTLFWVKNKFINKINFNNFKGVVISDKSFSETLSQIIIENPRLSFSKAISIIFPITRDDNKSLNLYVGKNVSFGSNTSFGQNIVIENGCVIGDNVIIGHNSVLRRNTKVGNNVEIGALTSIGGSGFGYEKNSSGIYQKIQHNGSVCIEDDVSIGDNVTIDRGMIGDTIICKNVKIDNQVHVAHNSIIGANTIITASVTVSGSVFIGENCWLGPNSTINNKGSLPNNSILGIGSILLKKVNKEGTYFGVPAKKL
tara:strand:+ start:146 stop:1012 length:867 start_codon:yes stop_codon:yes gene_type:complete